MAQRKDLEKKSTNMDSSAPTVDIAKIMQDSRTAVKSIITDKDVIVLLGNTGSGKSTTIHFMVGSKLRYDKTTASINVDKGPNIARDIEIGKGVTSQTKSFSPIDLSLKKPVLNIDYGLKESLFLCDTPGLKDTGGNGAAITNALTIANPLQVAKSVRFLVLFSFNDFDNKGQTLLGVLDSLSKLISNASVHTKAILYCFTGTPDSNRKDQVRAIVNSIISQKAELNYSDEIASLLEDMKKKISRNMSYIDIIENQWSSLSPQNLMKLLLALEPIKDPKAVIMPFVEKKDQEALSIELAKLVSAFTSSLEKLRQYAINEKISKENGNVIHTSFVLMEGILQQLHFIHEYLRAYDTDQCYSTCQRQLNEFSNSLRDAAGNIFNSSQPHKALTKNDVSRFALILEIQAELSFFASNYFDTSAEERQKQLELVSSIPQSYQKDLVSYLQPLKNRQLLRFQQKLIACLIKFQDNVQLSVTDPISTISRVKFSVGDLSVVNRIQAVTTHFNMDDSTQILTNVTKELNQVNKICGAFTNSNSIQTLLSNLFIVEPMLPAIEQFSEQQVSDIKNKEEAIDYLRKRAATFISYFRTAMKLHDFQTASEILKSLKTIPYTEGELFEETIITLYKTGFPLSVANIISSNVLALSIKVYPNTDELLTELIDALTNLLPDQLKTVTATKISSFTEDDIKKCLYVMPSILGISDQSDIYKNVVTKLDEYLKTLVISVNEIIEDETNIKNVSQFELLLQQFWYILSIPVKDDKKQEIEKIYQDAQDSIKTYINGFRQRFTQKLQAEKVSNEVYAEIKQYIEYLECSPYVHDHLKLKKESTEKLISLLETRAQLLMKKLDDIIATNFTNYADVFKDKWVVDELNVLFEFSKIISSEKLGEIKSKQLAFNDKVISMLREIKKFSTDEKFKNVSVAELLNYANYIKHCAKFALPHGELERVETIQAFEASVQNLMKNRSAYVMKLLQTLSIWQKQWPTSPSKDDVRQLVERLVALIKDLQNFQITLADYYDLCGDLKVGYENLLNENLTEFSELLSKALMAQYQSHSTVDKSKLNSLLQLCQQFVAFDELLPGNSNLEFKNYNVLHKKYTKLVSNEYKTIVNEIWAAVRDGQYELAAKKSEPLITESTLKKVLTEQINKAILKLKEDTETNLNNLHNERSSLPSVLPELIKNLNLLNTVENLYVAGLLTKEISSDCRNVVQSAPLHIDHWFAQCLQRLQRRIDQFKKSEFSNIFNKLKSSVHAMTIKPTHAIERLEKIEKSFAEQQEKIIADFQQPIEQWSKNKFPLAVLCVELIDCNEINLLTQIRQGVEQLIDNRFAQASQQYAASAMSTEDFIAALATLEKIVISLPEAEGLAELREKTLKKYRENVVQLIKNIQAETHFDIYFEKICGLITGINRYEISSIENLKLDLTATCSLLFKKLKTLQTDVSNSIKERKFPAIIFAELMTICDRAAKVGLEHAVTPYVKDCFKIVGKFTEELFQNLRAALLAYDSLREESLSKIHEGILQIAAIGQYRQSVELMFYYDFPYEMGIEEKIYNVIEQLIKLFNINKNTFENALNDRKAVGIASSLQVAENWQSVIAALTQYLSTKKIESGTKENELSNAIKKFNSAALLDLIKDEIGKIIERVKLTVVGYLHSTNKGTASRIEYFTLLTASAEFVVKCCDCDELASYIDTTPFKEQLLQSTKMYLSQLYQRALAELPTHITERKDWKFFEDCYKDLSLFAEYCVGYPAHLSAIDIEIIDNDSSTVNVNSSAAPIQRIAAVAAAKDIDCKFNQLLQSEITQQKRMIEEAKRNNTLEIFRPELMNFLLSLQSIINTLPSKAEEIKKTLGDMLHYIREKLEVNYFQFLMTELQEEEEGLGPQIIRDQACFKGVSIGIRNLLTSRQDIDYVLQKLTHKENKEDITPLDTEKANFLRENYIEFQKKYDELLKTYLSPDLNFNMNPEKHLGELLNELNRFIATDPIVSNQHGQIIWNDVAIKKIPKMMAYLFVIWTLRDSKAYFESSANQDRVNYLKSPHPGQVVAIFCMLNMVGKERELSNHLIQVLSGEGKSIVVAIVAELLALCDYSVNCACYSEYLSARDHDDFKDMFKFLGVSDHIKYGTFKSLCEDILNAYGDLRDLVENQITEEKSLRPSIEQHKRQTIVIIDEVDVFFSRDFYGSFYNVSLSFNRKEIFDLINHLWDQHKTEAGTITFNDVMKTKLYQVCIKKWSKLTGTINKSIKDMLIDLRSYKNDQGHQYSVVNGKIAYAYQDGTATDIDHGYKTMWAYYLEHERQKITPEEFKKNVGLKINCGNFAYSEVLKEVGMFKCILGVTGTLQELSEAEQVIVRDEFSIRQQTFIPSVYGDQRLTFPKKEGVKIHRNDHYYNELINEIKSKRTSTTSSSTDPIRPILVFFEDNESLMNFYNSAALKESGLDVGVMTQKSSTTTTEQNTEINYAISPGKITLIVKEKGRGRDFYCMSPKIEKNGGVHVILAFFPEQYSLEVQLLYRTARQGQSGSASMVLNELDLQHKFAITAHEIQNMRDENNIYAFLHDRRINNFAAEYKKLSDIMKEFRVELHEPSFNLWNHLRLPPENEENKALELLQFLNNESTKVSINKSHTLLLIDGTASMGSLIYGVKTVAKHLVTSISTLLEMHRIDPENFYLQIAVYRSYEEHPDDLFQASEWSNNGEALDKFIKKIDARGGSHSAKDDSREAIEVGLYHAEIEADAGRLTQVILMGDVGPTPAESLASTEEGRAGAHARKPIHQGRFYSNKFEDAFTVAGRLASKNIPVHTFFVKSFAEQDFKKIAEITKGKSNYLDVNATDAPQKLFTLFGGTLIDEMAGGDERLKEKMKKEFTEISHKSYKS